MSGQNENINNNLKNIQEEEHLITFQDIVKDKEIKTYLEMGDKYLGTLGYTNHSLLHAQRVAKIAHMILISLNYDRRTAELARIAGYIHDIGNVINRADHAQSSAMMAFNILTRMGTAPLEIAKVIGAIGNHDEGTGIPVNSLASALIIADKTDVRRSRVKTRDNKDFDIHDRVNYDMYSLPADSFMWPLMVKALLSPAARCCSAPIATSPMVHSMASFSLALPLMPVMVTLYFRARLPLLMTRSSGRV